MDDGRRLNQKPFRKSFAGGLVRPARGKEFITVLVCIRRGSKRIEEHLLEGENQYLGD